MRCDRCPLNPLAPDDVCDLADDPKYGMTHKDGGIGCRHSYNWAKKKDDEYSEYLRETAEGIAKLIEEDRKRGEKNV